MSCLTRTVKASKPAATIAGEVPAINIAKPGDPVWSVSFNGRTLQVPAPASVVIGTGADHPTLIRVPHGFGTYGPHTEVRLWQARLTGSRSLSATLGGVFDYGPSGTGRPMLGNGLGDGLSWTALAQASEYRKTGDFHHALRFTMNSSQGCWGNGFKAPAIKTDQSGIGPIVMGQKWRLDITDAEIAQRVSPTGRADHTRLLRALLRAMKKYGLYLGDGGGPGFLLELEDDASGQWSDSSGSRLPQAPSGYGFGAVIRGPSSSGCSGTCTSLSGLPFDRLVPLAQSQW
jgi:hypothetical protein